MFNIGKGKTSDWPHDWNNLNGLNDFNNSIGE
jgi:hypothetical protein